MTDPNIKGMSENIQTLIKAKPISSWADYEIGEEPKKMSNVPPKNPKPKTQNPPPPKPKQPKPKPKKLKAPAFKLDPNMPKFQVPRKFQQPHQTSQYQPPPYLQQQQHFAPQQQSPISKGKAPKLLKSKTTKKTKAPPTMTKTVSGTVPPPGAPTGVVPPTGTVPGTIAPTSRIPWVTLLIILAIVLIMGLSYIIAGIGMIIFYIYIRNREMESMEWWPALKAGLYWPYYLYRELSGKSIILPRITLAGVLEKVKEKDPDLPEYQAREIAGRIRAQLMKVA